MEKSAMTELQAELQRLLHYAQSHQPSRVKLAGALRDLGQRVMADADPSEATAYLERDLSHKAAGDAASANQLASSLSSTIESFKNYVENWVEDHGDAIGKDGEASKAARAVLDGFEVLAGRGKDGGGLIGVIRRVRAKGSL
jgi:hypothetical protein